MLRKCESAFPEDTHLVIQDANSETKSDVIDTYGKSNAHIFHPSNEKIDRHVKLARSHSKLTKVWLSDNRESLTNVQLTQADGSTTWQILKERALNDQARELIYIWFSPKKANHFTRNTKNVFWRRRGEEGQCRAGLTVKILFLFRGLQKPQPQQVFERWTLCNVRFEDRWALQFWIEFTEL